MKFLKKIFKKKYKIRLTEDEIFIAGPAIHMWMEQCNDGLKETNDNEIKEIYKRDMKICFDIINKIKKADGTIREEKKWDKKYKKYFKKGRKKNE